MDVGFIGLGQMGSAIALNLVKAGRRVTVYNRTHTKAEALASGRQNHETPADACRSPGGAHYACRRFGGRGGLFRRRKWPLGA